MSGLHIPHQRNYHAVRWTLALVLMIIIASYAYFGVRWYNTGELSPLPLPVAATDTSLDERDITEAALESHSAKADEPRFIEIPKLGLSVTRVERVGVTDRRMLDAPKHVLNAGWYTKSSKPGAGVGAVVLDGHIKGARRDGAFAKVSDLARGDQITIERGDGKRFTYEVVDTRNQSVQWLNSIGMKEMMYSADPSKEGLSLIADAGQWIPRDKTYDHRTVVRATLVE